MTRTLPIYISGLALLLLACGSLTFLSAPTPIPTSTHPPSPSPTETATAAPTASPTNTATLPPSETPSPTLTPTLTAYLRGPGEINVPILLYHHVGVSRKGDTVYYISPDAFDREMNLLYQWGYRTISVELLVRAIREGAELPARPIILTFDDGGETVHSAALPIMQRYGFTGTAYIVHNYVGIPGFMDVDQIRELYAADWEIGSHGLSHQDLPKHPARQRNEIVSSRRKLESLLDLPVASFSYPFGAYDSDSLYYVHYVDYIAAMGLGEETVQGSDNLFYLYRQPVTGTDDLAAFAALLPWQGYTINLPALTIVP